MKLRITWEVDNGYAGPSRPQYTNFDSNDYYDDEEWNELSEEEKQETIEDAVQADFDRQINWHIKNKMEIE